MGRQMVHTGGDPLCKCCPGDSSPHDSRLLLLILTMQQPGRTPEQGESMQFFRQGEKRAPAGTRTGAKVHWAPWLLYVRLRGVTTCF